MTNTKPSPEESGRPTIDAPTFEHRRWIVSMLDRLLEDERRIHRVASKMFVDRQTKLAQVEKAILTRDVTIEHIVKAYVDGHEAERRLKACEDWHEETSR